MGEYKNVYYPDPDSRFEPARTRTQPVPDLQRMAITVAAKVEAGDFAGQEHADRGDTRTLDFAQAFATNRVDEARAHTTAEVSRVEAAIALLTGMDPVAVTQLRAALDEYLAGVSATDSVVSEVVAQPGSQTRAMLANASPELAASGLHQVVAVPTGGVLDHARVQSAATQAKAEGKRLYAAGAYSTDQTLVVESDADLSGLTITYTGGSAAVRVGSTSTLLFRKRIDLPPVVNAGKTQPGWAQVIGSTGYDLVNVHACMITAPLAQSFDTGMRVHGQGQGTVHNHIHLGQLLNNRVNLLLSRAGGGWCNQNQFYGGRLSHLSAEGLNVAGAAHIRTEAGTTNPINSNEWHGTSIEWGTAEYHLDVGGSNQLFDNLRFEVAEGARVRWRTASIGNVIREGYQAHGIVQTWEAGAARNQIRAYNYWSHPSDRPLLFGNTGSAANQTLTLMDPTGITTGANPDTAYRWAWSGHELRGKRAAEAFDRIRVDGNNGRLYFGTGATEPTAFLGMAGPALRIDGIATTTSAAAGGATALPATPTGYLSVYIDGAIRKFPYFN